MLDPIGGSDMPFEQSKLQALINGGIWSNGKKSIVYKIGGGMACAVACLDRDLAPKIAISRGVEVARCALVWSSPSLSLPRRSVGVTQSTP